jgi:hypothetical protein
MKSLEVKRPLQARRQRDRRVTTDADGPNQFVDDRAQEEQSQALKDD